jgi:hypothetical protein
MVRPPGARCIVTSFFRRVRFAFLSCRVVVLEIRYFISDPDSYDSIFLFLGGGSGWVRNALPNYFLQDSEGLTYPALLRGLFPLDLADICSVLFFFFPISLKPFGRSPCSWDRQSDSPSRLIIQSQSVLPAGICSVSSTIHLISNFFLLGLVFRRQRDHFLVQLKKTIQPQYNHPSLLNPFFAPCQLLDPQTARSTILLGLDIPPSSFPRTPPIFSSSSLLLLFSYPSRL